MRLLFRQRPMLVIDEVLSVAFFLIVVVVVVVVVGVVVMIRYLVLLVDHQTITTLLH